VPQPQLPYNHIITFWQQVCHNNTKLFDFDIKNNKTKKLLMCNKMRNKKPPKIEAFLNIVDAFC